ncbi:hypothetical protein [Streptosporangium carneum]|uniref:Uncharacterized protein n=1 Tax=Streptosporangium carneum TaxID=47481 RepID=A0A9W6MAZ1_9ACTN|nr:hypothetical protein [Streptosporangium carneum]GLK07108.1 hypothetical protein GCM10017600_05130 [Streptosporangium carneum]
MRTRILAAVTLTAGVLMSTLTGAANADTPPPATVTDTPTPAPTVENPALDEGAFVVRCEGGAVIARVRKLSEEEIRKLKEKGALFHERRLKGDVRLRGGESTVITPDALGELPDPAKLKELKEQLKEKAFEIRVGGVEEAPGGTKGSGEGAVAQSYSIFGEAAPGEPNPVFDEAVPDVKGPADDTAAPVKPHVEGAEEPASELFTKVLPDGDITIVESPAAGAEKKAFSLEKHGPIHCVKRP